MTLPTEVINYSANQLRILEMLGNGLSPSVVASALGISESYISQLMSEEAFAQQVTEKRFANLQAATVRDRSYDSIEDALLEKLQDLLPMMYKPMEVVRAITVVNAAKRRGGGPESNPVIHNTVVQLNLPGIIQTKFIRDVNNQVVGIGDQQLITIDSKTLTSKLEASKLKQVTNHDNNSEASTDSTRAALSGN